MLLRSRVFFCGDSGFFDGFRDIGRDHGPFDLTLISSGAYDRTWPMIHMTPEDVVKRIAAECAFVDERGAVGIRLEPAAAIVRQYGEQFRTRRRQRRPRPLKPPPLL